MVKGKAVCVDLLILLLLAVIPFLFYWSSMLFFNNTDIFLNTSDFLHRLTYIWDSKAPLGADLGWGMGGFFPFFSFIMGFLSLRLPIFIVDKLWLIFLLFLSGASMYFLMSVIIGKPRRLAKIVAALAYMYNLFVLVNLNSSGLYLTFYGAIPIMLGIYIYCLNKNPTVRYAVVLALASFLISAYNPTYIIISFLVLLSYLIYYFLSNGFRNLKKILLFNLAFLVTYICVNLYWILPVFNFTRNAYWAGIFSEPLQMHNLGSSYVEIFRLLGAWGFYSGYQGQPYFAISPVYLQNGFIIMTTLLLPVVAIVPLLLKPRPKYTMFFALMLLVSIPLAVAAYPTDSPYPLGQVYNWAYSHIPLFSVFRENYKFVLPIALSYCGLIGLLVQRLLQPVNLNLTDIFRKPHFKFSNPKLKSLLHNSSFRVAVVASLILLILINAWPMYTGNAIDKDHTIQEIPDYWYQAADWMNSQNGDGRIFLLPEQYFAVYTWGGTPGSVGNINVPLFERDQVFQQPSSGSSEYSTNIIQVAYDAIAKNETQYAGKILSLLGVEYILQRNDFNYEYYNVESPQQVKSLLSYQTGIEYVNSFGELDFYNNNYALPRVYAATSAIYINGSDATLSFLNLQNLDLSSTVLFFNSTSKNQESTYSSKVEWSLDNFGSVAPYFINYPWRGKYFETGAVGHIEYVKLYVKNADPNHDGLATVSFARSPNEAPLHTVHVPTPKNFKGWVYGKVDIDWNYDSIFVYRAGDAYSTLGVDYNPDYDGYQSSDGLSWTQCSERYYIGLDYLQPQNVGAQASAGGNAPSLSYTRVNPTEYTVQVTSEKPFFLVFSESFHPQWTAFIDGQTVSAHLLSNGYSNCWYINKTGQFQITIQYTPQALYDIAKTLSLVSLAVALAVVLVPLVPRKNGFQFLNSCMKTHKLPREPLMAFNQRNLHGRNPVGPGHNHKGS